MSQSSVTPEQRKVLRLEFLEQRNYDPERLPYIEWLESLVIEGRGELTREDASAVE